MSTQHAAVPPQMKAVPAGHQFGGGWHSISLEPLILKISMMLLELRKGCRWKSSAGLQILAAMSQDKTDHEHRTEESIYSGLQV